MSYPALPQNNVVDGETGHESDHDSIYAGLAAIETAVPFPPGGTTTFLRADSTWASPGGGSPTGSAGGVLSGTYPNPGFATTPLPESGGTMTGALIPAVVALTDAATIAVNAALGNDFRVTLGGNRTLGAPSNPGDGQRILFQITQDGSGNRTLAYNAAYEFSSSLPSPTLSSGANITDLLGFIYNATKGKWLFVAFVSGFS